MTQEMYLLYGSIGLIAMAVIYYFFNRWVFRVRRHIWNQRQQISLLIQIARQLGVKEDLSALEEKNKQTHDDDL